MDGKRDTSFLRNWEDLPESMRIPEVRPYWEALNRKRLQLLIKRVLDILLSILMILLLAVPMLIVAALIKLDSPGPVFFRQARVTSYGKHFMIHKFRTMVDNAQNLGSTVTVKGDSRITRVGNMLRKLRIDELPQLFDVLSGDMSFVGTRPEAVKYVDKYSPKYLATLLMPAGITSEASIRYKDEDELLNEADDVDSVYINEILPEKMRWNLKSIEEFSVIGDIKTMFRTVGAVLSKD